jgi:autotransporter-associated beta strand protein
MTCFAYPAYSLDLLWDSNAGSPGQTDGGGSWLSANQWWDGSNNTNWNNATPDNAIIGNGGSGGTLTPGFVTAGNITFTNFSGTYTVANANGALSTSSGITISANAGNVTLNNTNSGTGGITKNNPGVLLLSNLGNNYTGPTVVNNGILQCGTGFGNTHSIPGGLGGSAGGSNIELNGGNLKIWWPFTRTLGAGQAHVQFTGGSSGFSFMQADRWGQITFNGSASYEVVWGSTYFNPAELVLNEAAASPGQVVRIDNKIDLNGTNRTIACNSTKSISSASQNGNMSTAGGRLMGAIRNSGATPAGIIKVGPGWLQLNGINTFDGDTVVQEGTLDLNASSTIDDAAILRVAAGAKVNLRTGVNETVYQLFLDDFSVAIGTWGSSTSSATNVDDIFFSGDGMITVLNQAPPPGTVISLQ